MTSAAAHLAESAQPGVRDLSARGSAHLRLQRTGADEHADARIVERLKRGDERALGELVRRYERRMIKLALKYVRDRATAEDVVQETWLAVLTGYPQVRGAGPAQELDLRHPRQPGEDPRRPRCSSHPGRVRRRLSGRASRRVT